MSFNADDPDPTPVSLFNLTFALVVSLFLFGWLFLPTQAAAFACQSNGTGNWSAAGTWTNCNSTTPQSTDTIEIMNGHTVTLNTSATVATTTIDAGGTLTEDTAGRTLTVTSGWLNNGTFTAASSTVKFSGTQTITGGTTFYNLEFNAVSNSKVFTIPAGTYATTTGTLTISGNNSLRVLTGNVDIKGDVVITNTASHSNSNGDATFTFLGTANQLIDASAVTNGQGRLPKVAIDKPSGTLTLKGIISLAGNWTYVNGVVDATTYDSTVVTRTNLAIDGQGTSQTMSFDNLYIGDNASTYTATLDGELVVAGNLTFSTSGRITANNNNISVAGNWTMLGSNVFNSGSNTVIFNGVGTSTVDTGGIDTNHDFQNLTIAKTGGGVVQLATNNLDVDGTLTVSSGTLDLNGLNLSTTAACSITGTLKLQGPETVSCTPTLNTGSTVEYSASTTVATQTVKDWNYTNASTTINAPGDTISDSGTRTIGGNFTITAGTYSAPTTLNVAGNFTNAGTFTHNNGTVVLNGTNQTLAGSATFYNLTKTEATNNSTDATLTFEAGATTTIASGGLLTLDGLDDSDRINLVSSSPGSPWYLTISGSTLIDYVDVTDSNASGGSQVLPANSNGIARNTNWNFGGNTTPTVSSLGPSGLTSGAWSNDNTPTFTFTTADLEGSNLSYELTVDDTASFSSPVYQATSTYDAPGPISTTTGVLPEGQYYWRVLVGDGTATSSYTVANGGAVAFGVDTAAPTAGSITFSGVTTAAITASSTGVSDGLSGLATNYLQYHATSTAYSAYSGATSSPWVLTGLTSNTAYHFEVGVQDAAGNWATSTIYSTTTLAIPPVTYYVDGTLAADCTSGNYSIANRNCTGSDGKAYNTIQEAANVVSAGDTVYVRAGNYNEWVHVTADGSSSAKITFQNYSGEAPVIDGTGISLDSQNGILYLDQAAYIVINGFTIRNSSRGVMAYRSSYDEIRNCVINTNTSDGLRLRGSSHVLIEDNEIYDNALGLAVTWHDTSQTQANFNIIQNNLIHNNTRGNPEGSDGIALSSGSFDNQLLNNVVYGNYDDGIDSSTGGGSSGTGCNLRSTISGNLSFSNGDGAGAGDGNGIKVSTNCGGEHTLTKNVVFDNDRGGFDQDKGSGFPENLFYHNTAYHNGNVSVTGGFLMDAPSLPQDEDAILYNNIGASNTDHDLDRSNDLAVQISNYNFWADGNFPAGQDDHSLSGDPLFANPSTEIDTTFEAGWTISQKLAHIRDQVEVKLSLQSGSRAVNAGTIIVGYHCALSDDVDDTQTGCVHWSGSAPDLGAYEYVSGETPADTTAPTLSEVTPITTPTSDATPNYTFASTEAGTITYGGSCSSVTTSASLGSNTITLSTLANGSYSNCTITVTDASGNPSSALTISPFVVSATVSVTTEDTGGNNGGGGGGGNSKKKTPTATSTWSTATTTTRFQALTGNLSLGLTSPQVTTLQQMLAQDPTVYPNPQITGYFGPLTKAAVIRFQQKYGIVTTPANAGLVGPNTRAKLNALYATSATSLPTSPTTPSATVQQLQLRLQLLQLQLQLLLRAQGR